MLRPWLIQLKVSRRLKLIELSNECGLTMIEDDISFWETSDLVLANVEALANTEYEIGAWGTNWKTYRIECTKTVGLDYGLVYTQTYTYWTDACGKGSGTCLSSAGC